VQAYGRFLERHNRPQEAKKLYDDFVAKSNGSDSLSAAFRRLKSGKKPERLVNNVDEGMAEVFFNLSGTLAQGRSTDLALIYGRFALRLRPDFPLAQVLLGGLLESLDRKQEALALYDEVNPSSPLFWAARLRKAETLDELKRTDEAIAQLRMMAKERADEYEPLTRLGDMLRAKKQYAEAASSYSQAVKRIGRLDKSHWSLLYARGIAYERSKQWPKAEADFLHALKLSPEQPFVLNYLGYSWVDQGMHLDRAKEMIERAVQLRPNDGYIVDSLGWVLYRLHDYEGAARRLERAVLLRPDDPTINDHLGDAYWRVGRYLEARFQWRRALSLDPEKKDIPAIEKKLQRGLADAPTKDSRG
jgi:tetratricopeptide (TPR) repeat protein